MLPLFYIGDEDGLEVLDKLMGINSYLVAFLGVGIFGILSALIKLGWNHLSRVNGRLDNLERAMVAIIHDLLYKQCCDYLDRGYITTDEMDNLNYLWNSYHSMGGNGTGERLYNRVCQLKIREEDD